MRPGAEQDRRAISLGNEGSFTVTQGQSFLQIRLHSRP